MLQIVTGMYFRGIPVRKTDHRAVFYTNGSKLLRADEIKLPIGLFLLSTGHSPTTPITIEVAEQLPDREGDILVSTGGAELLNDVASVFAFSMNLTCSRNLALVERLVPGALAEGPSSRPSSVLRRTFDPTVAIRDDDVKQAATFCTQLLALRRSHFEAAMRAIKRVIDATYLVSDDPSLAYTLFVTSLESLAQISTSPEDIRSWQTYDSKKRTVIDKAIADLSPEQAERVRQAVLEIDQLSLARRFRSFVLDHVTPAYYRSEAAEAIGAIRAHDLPHALAIAYRFRSRNVHQLELLARELWLVADRSDTVSLEGRSALSLEGLNRLCRHVIRSFVERSPTELDEDFNYIEYLPGHVRMQWAPQYWIGRGDTFTSAQKAPARLEGLIELLLQALTDEDAATLQVDMTPVLDKIERMLPGERKVEARQPMIAIYLLWHRFLRPEHHLPKAETIINKYEADLDAPSMVGFAVRLLAADAIEWADDELEQLVEVRRSELKNGRGQSLPASFDAALLLCLAERVWDERPTQALSLISGAVEVVPGNEILLGAERAAEAGDKPVVNLWELVTGTEPAHLGNDPQADRSSGGEGTDGKNEPSKHPTRNPRDSRK